MFNPFKESLAFLNLADWNSCSLVSKQWYDHTRVANRMCAFKLNVTYNSDDTVTIKNAACDIEKTVELSSVIRWIQVRPWVVDRLDIREIESVIRTPSNHLKTHTPFRRAHVTEKVVRLFQCCESTLRVLSMDTDQWNRVFDCTFSRLEFLNCDHTNQDARYYLPVPTFDFSERLLIFQRRLPIRTRIRLCIGNSLGEPHDHGVVQRTRVNFLVPFVSELYLPCRLDREATWTSLYWELWSNLTSLCCDRIQEGHNVPQTVLDKIETLILLSQNDEDIENSAVLHLPSLTRLELTEETTECAHRMNCPNLCDLHLSVFGYDAMARPDTSMWLRSRTMLRHITVTGLDSDYDELTMKCVAHLVQTCRQLLHITIAYPRVLFPGDREYSKVILAKIQDAYPTIHVDTIEEYVDWSFCY